MITTTDILHIPSTTGVYFFYEGKTPIYIGKAVNLKARLTSHLQNAKLDAKERAIIEHADRVDFVQTLSDFDAIILETNLVRKFMPKYNIELKDDKSYLYIKIAIKEEYPKISLVRRENDGKSLYFGPFQSTRLTRSLLSHIRRIVPFCTQRKIGKAPCFYSKIGLCNPCPSVIEKMRKDHVGAIHESPSAEELQQLYRRNIRMIIKILEGKSTLLLTDLEQELASATENEDYELALQYRDKLLLLENLIFTRSFSRWDDVRITNNEELVESIKRFMDTNFKDSSIDLSFRIECYDISNLFGKDATASMVVFENGGVEKKEYRRFKIKTVKGISDFAMLQEVLTRRFKRDSWRKPNLLIIDGGPPQLRATKKVLTTLSLSIPMIGIAKHPDRLYKAGKKITPATVDRNSLFFKVIQEIRDESHRFAKKYHLLLRNKKMMYN